MFKLQLPLSLGTLLTTEAVKSYFRHLPDQEEAKTLALHAVEAYVGLEADCLAQMIKTTFSRRLTDEELETLERHFYKQYRVTYILRKNIDDGRTKIFLVDCYDKRAQRELDSIAKDPSTLQYIGHKKQDDNEAEV